MTNEELVIACKRGEVDFDLVYERNIGMVVNEAKRWFIKDMDYNDNISVLMMATYEAVDKYDPSLGYNFNTFLGNHLRYRMREEYRNTTLKRNGSDWSFLSSDETMPTKDWMAFQRGVLGIGRNGYDNINYEKALDIINVTLNKQGELGRLYTNEYLFNHTTITEIADIHNTYPRIVSYHVHFCLNKITKELQKNGLVLRDCLN